MQIVEPIRDRGMVAKIGDYLRRWDKRYFLMFEFGIYTGLRISDILALTYGDIIEQYTSGRRRWKEHIERHEIKTGRRRLIPLRDTSLGNLIARELKPITQWDLDEPIFLSARRGPDGSRHAIGRWQAYHVLRQAARQCGVLGHVGTHTLRKTFGYHVYQRTRDVAQLQALFGHTSQAITLRYIGVSQDTHDAAYRVLNFDGRIGTEKTAKDAPQKTGKQLRIRDELY